MPLRFLSRTHREDDSRRINITQVKMKSKHTGTSDMPINPQLGQATHS